MRNIIIIKDPFEMPAVGETVKLTLMHCVDLVPHCWIWNPSVGYLEVMDYGGFDIYITVKNVGMKENATSGTVFPSCMKFMNTAPIATPIIDNTVTCLRADFNCPAVGQTALMSVDSTSAIRTGDIIIVDTRYQYVVTEIINEHTMRVLNEGKGKDGGVINIDCNECVPVKILENSHCCEALQEQVDDIYSKFDIKKSIVPKTDSLISVTNGSNSLTDVFNDVILDVDTDLSKYDNTTSQFITLNDIPPIPTVNDATLTIYDSDRITRLVSFSANAATNVTATLPVPRLQYFEESLGISGGVRTSVFYPKSGAATASNLGTSTDSFSNIYVNEIHGGNGKSSYIRFRQDGADTEYYNGTSSAYNAHAFFSGGKRIVSFAHDEAYFFTMITPNPTSTFTLGLVDKTWANIFTDALTLNGTTYTSIPTDTADLTNGAGFITSASLPTVNDATLDIQKNGVSVGTFTANASTNSTVNITVPTDTNDLTNGAGYITSASIPTVNNATLDIQKNGTSVGTFTANASTNSTVNITVPTDTNDLTNGAGFITSASLPTVNNATLDIQQNGTSVGTFTANASTNSTVNITVPTDTSDLTNGAEYITGGVVLNVDVPFTSALTPPAGGNLNLTSGATYTDTSTTSTIINTYSKPMLVRTSLLMNKGQIFVPSGSGNNIRIHCYVSCTFQIGAGLPASRERIMMTKSFGGMAINCLNSLDGYADHYLVVPAGDTLTVYWTNEIKVETLQGSAYIGDGFGLVYDLDYVGWLIA